MNKYKIVIINNQVKNPEIVAMINLFQYITKSIEQNIDGKFGVFEIRNNGQFDWFGRSLISSVAGDIAHFKR